MRPRVSKALSAQAKPLIERLSPGGLLMKTDRLRGGLSARMDVLEYAERDRTVRHRVVLRRFTDEDDARGVAREFELLQALQSAGVAAPRPILRDGGEFFGVPAIVMSYLPGTALIAPQDDGWTPGIAAAALAVHRVTRKPPSLQTFGREEMAAKLRGWRRWAPPDPLSGEIFDALEARLPHLELLPPTIVHNDFWSGNVIWDNGEVTGVVDWSDSVFGDRRADISECRIDFVLGHGIEVADRFRADYERLAGEPLRDLWYFDLFRGVRALGEWRTWLNGYRDLIAGQARVVHVQQGRDLGLDLDERHVGQRLHAFLRRALDESRLHS